MSTFTTLLERGEPSSETRATNAPDEHPAPPLDATLVALGVQPFIEESVKRYKEMRLREARRELRLPFPLYYRSVAALLNIGALLGGAGATVAIVGTVFGYTHEGNVFFTLFYIICVAALTLATVTLERLRIPYWKQERLDSESIFLRFHEPPPESTRLAKDIRERLPDAQIFVERLTQTNDPFLLVVHEGKRRYVAAWDEPTLPDWFDRVVR